MNKAQLFIMWIGIALIVLMGLFPPLAATIHGGIEFKGYGFVLSRHGTGVHIYFARLLIQWFIVGIVTVGVIVTLKYHTYDEKRNREK